MLLTFDWTDGANHGNFLGFAIERTPGFGADGASSFLLNKLDFKPPENDDAVKPSDQAPFQKFNWWDGGIEPKDRGTVLKYKVIPVVGTGPDDLQLQRNDAVSISVRVPELLEDGIATYFNRAVVSAQSFLRLKDKPLDQQMTWLANGLQDAVPEALAESDAFDCAIYHLSDKLWVLPALQKFAGSRINYLFRQGEGRQVSGGHRRATEEQR